MSGKECKQVCGVCSFGSWNNRKSKIIVLCKWCYGDSLHIVWSEWWRVPMFAAHAVRTNIITYHTMLPLNHCATSTYLSPSPEPWWCKCMWCAHMTVAYILQNTRDPKCVRQWVPCREWVWNIKGNVRARNAAQKSHKFAKQNSLAFFFFRKAFFRPPPRLLLFFACVLRRALVVVNLHKKWFSIRRGLVRLNEIFATEMATRWMRMARPGRHLLDANGVFAYRAHRWMRERVNSTDPPTTAQTTFPVFLCSFFSLLQWPFTFITHTRTSAARIHNDNGIRMSF